MIPENDYIKPVETLSNIGSLTPIDKHSQKRRRQEQPHKNSKSHQDTPNDSQDETGGSEISPNKSGYVDYQA
jgi:hypothetical protein